MDCREWDVNAVERNLAGIIERARARHVDVLLCGMETPPLHGFQYSLAFHGIFPKVCRRVTSRSVPFLLADMAATKHRVTASIRTRMAPVASRIRSGPTLHP